MSLPLSAWLAVGLAISLAAGISALAAMTDRRRGFAPWWGALAVGMGDIVVHLGVLPPAFPPVDVTDRLPLVALAAMVAAALIQGVRGGWKARSIAYLTLEGVILAVLLEPIIRAGEFPRETILQLAAVVVASALALVNVAWLDDPDRKLELTAALTCLSLGGGVVLLLGHSAVLFQLAGLLAVVVVASLAGARGRAIGGAIPVAASVLAALFVEGSVYASLPTGPALVVAAAPAWLWLLRLGPIARLGPKTRVVLAAGLMAIPLAIALGWMAATMSFDGY